MSILSKSPNVGYSDTDLKTDQEAKQSENRSMQLSVMLLPSAYLLANKPSLPRRGNTLGELKLER